MSANTYQLKSDELHCIWVELCDIFFKLEFLTDGAYCGDDAGWEYRSTCKNSQKFYVQSAKCIYR